MIFIVWQSLLLLVSPKAGFSLSYWDAIYEIGYNPETRRIEYNLACYQIEQWMKFKNAIHAKPIVDEKLIKEIRDVESRIPSLDVGNLYTKLKYFDDIDLWRGAGIRGEIVEGHYKLTMLDPDIANWANSSSKDMPECWGPQKTFGDFGLRAFIRPSSQNRYRLKTEAHVYTDTLRLSNIARMVQQLAAVAWSQTKMRQNSPIASDSALNDQSRWVMGGLAIEFPHLYELLSHYFTVENMVSGDFTGSNDKIPYDIAIRINVDAVKASYPHLGAQLNRLKNITNYQLELVDTESRPIGKVTFDGDTYLLRVVFKTKEGRFFVLKENAIDEYEGGINLTNSGHQLFYAIQTFKMDMIGLKLNVKALKVKLDYYHDHSTANVTYELRQMPEEISAEGLLMGFLPIWLIDLFIPSNIEEMTREFFRTLTTGNDGQGAYLMLGGIPEKSLANHSWLITDAEVMSNGTIKFAFNLQRNMFRGKDKLLEEISAFSRRLWNAFYLDYQNNQSLQPNQTCHQ